MPCGVYVLATKALRESRERTCLRDGMRAQVRTVAQPAQVRTVAQPAQVR